MDQRRYPLPKWDFCGNDGTHTGQDVDSGPDRTDNPLYRLYRDYHDHEWGVPCHDDRRLFEFLLLEGAQAGLSWITILRKREAYRHAFGGFDPERVACYRNADIVRLLNDPGIVRNRLKIVAAVNNARRFLDTCERFGSFDEYLWRFVDGKPIQNAWRSLSEVPAETDISRALSKDLSARGYKFVGATICYAFMQAIGMVDDHLVSCHRHGICAVSDQGASSA